MVGALASVVGPRRAEKVGRLLWERLMRRWVNAARLGTGARWLSSGRLGRRRTALDGRRRDRRWGGGGRCRDGWRSRLGAGRGWLGGCGCDRAGGYDGTGRAEWLSRYDSDRRNNDNNRGDSERGDRDRPQPARPRPALARKLASQIGGRLAMGFAYVSHGHQNFSTVTASSRPAGSVVRMGPTPRA